MKHFFNNLKTWAVVLAVASAAPVAGQNIPVVTLANTPDEKPAPAGPHGANANFTHTGTDALTYEKSGQPFQVMVWDSGPVNSQATSQVTLSWSVDTGSGLVKDSKTLQGNYSDPDVVIAYRGDGIYVNIICIDRNAGLVTNGVPGGQTKLFGYKWQNNNFNTQAFTPFLLGSRLRRHSSPNIDANSLGMTAMVWQESQESITTVTVSSLDFPTYSFTQTITFGRSYLAGSYINTGVTGIGGCYYASHVPGISDTGYPVIDPPTGLFEQTLRPDVAISETPEEKNAPVVSTTFIRHYVDGLGAFSIIDKLDVHQTLYNRCQDGENGGIVLTPVDSREWDLNSSLPIVGSPRIASIPDMDQNTADVEVVLDQHNSGCFENIYEVRNYGKSQNAFRDESTLVSLPDETFKLDGCQAQTNLRRQVAKEPVVSYHAMPEGLKGLYMVSWTGYNYHEVKGSVLNSGDIEEDVISVSMIQGMPVNPYSGSNVSRFYNAVNEQREGNQHTPSIAGRHLMNNTTAHLFVDDFQGQLSYRQTDVIAGDGQAFRPAVIPSGGSSTSPKLLQAYPNPAEAAVTVELRLHKGETARQLTVVDQVGRVVDTIALTGEGQALDLTWQPAAKLPSGTYTLKLLTSERTATFQISRK